jgi:hypothetical protein
MKRHETQQQDSRRPCSRHYHDKRPFATAVLLSLSRKCEPLERTTRCNRHLAIPQLKREKRLPFPRVIRESVIGARQPIAFRFDRFGRFACLDGAGLKAKTRPLWTIVSHSISSTIPRKGVQFELLRRADIF